MKEQAGLGERKRNDNQSYNQTQICRVTSTANYGYGKIDVVGLDYSQPSPVWVVGSLDKKPEAGDLVLIGYIQGRADSPYLQGFVHNKHYTSNFIKIESDNITIQMPTDATDIANYMTDDSYKASRMTIEVTASGVAINGAYAARVGDTVLVSVPGVGTCTGTITSGATG